MVKLRKFAAYQHLERPYTRISKFSKKNFVRGGYPNIKISKFDMGDPKKKYDTTMQLISERDINIRHNALESARMTSNRLLEKNLQARYHYRLKAYPFHILRENPLAAGAGADRTSKGMKKAFGKVVGAAARIKSGQTVFELKIDKIHAKIGREALTKASKKLPCPCRILTF